MQRPLGPLVLALMAGIGTGSAFMVSRTLLLAGFAVLLALLLIFRLRIKRRPIIPCLLAGFYLLGMLGIARYSDQSPPPDHLSHFIGKGKIALEGVITGQPRVLPDRTDMVVSASRVIRKGITSPVRGLVLLSLRSGDVFHYGDYLLCNVSLKAPRNFNNPGGYDYKRSLIYRDIRVRGYLKDSSEILLLREQQGGRLRAAVENFRQRLKDFIRAHAPPPEGDVIAALTVGMQQEIPTAVRDNFNKTGTAHILAISGFHVGMIAALSLMIIGSVLKLFPTLLLRVEGKKISALIALPPVMIYLFIAGLGFSVLRATIMTAALLTAILLHRGKNHFNLLALAALVILIISPPALFDISFQLSFTAVLSLLTLTPRLTGLAGQVGTGPARQKSLPRRFGGAVFLFAAVTFSATLGTLPLIAFYFNRVSSSVIIANLLVVPLLGMITLPLCLAIIVAYPLSPTAALFLLNLALPFVTAALRILDYLAALPGASFLIATPGIAEILAYYLALFILAKLIDRRLGRMPPERFAGRVISADILKIGLGICVLYLLGHPLYLHLRETTDRSLRLTAIDVGQGSATLIEFPRGKKMLLDGGGTANSGFDMGRRVLARLLWQRRIGRIDIVVLSHPHPDHLQGLLYILDNFSVGEVWETGQESSEELSVNFHRIIRDRGIPRRIVTQKTRLKEIGGVKISILNPPSPPDAVPDGNFAARNDASLVMRLALGEVGFLLPADIAAAAEMRLVSEQVLSPTDVLWVPHHGGLTSSTLPFLRLLSPRIALISCGAANPFGDPHPAVLERYGRLGAHIFRTDQDGAITVATDGRVITVRSFMGRGLSLFPRAAKSD